MHIILGLLGAIITILILANRLNDSGIDLGWLNPFSWHRRRTFRKNHDLNPVFKLDSPLDVAGLLVTGVAKVDGDITATQKSAILEVFEQEFHLSPGEAKDMLTSSVYLIGNGQEFFSNPARSLERAYDQFKPNQVDSIKDLLQRVADIDGSPSGKQAEYMKKVLKGLPTVRPSKW
ncbi:TerB family tellurite resistance protein [Pseudoalteromonas sp. R3]|uniref:tellurite resistance TerB family protein n=1 Tax=Pseudoalteromonas sp. R3 TaxID=1709477 RepID=UPI0006B6646F|nr:TerB family tellurite resistance protein [Pseudoalteromonas sp. R3]AZZ98405.1 TerB family tellurite resistance protein [Pseudoalteromonas sp. R3]